MKFNDLLKQKYGLLNEQPPETLDAPEDATETPAPEEPAAEEPTEEAPKLNTQGVQYLVDLIRKALLIDKLNDREKVDLINLTIDANNAFDNLENKILPILNKYIPETIT
jgi:hypothetical protein